MDEINVQFSKTKRDRWRWSIRVGEKSVGVSPTSYDSEGDARRAYRELEASVFTNWSRKSKMRQAAVKMLSG